MRIIVLMNSLNTGGAEFSTLTLYQWLKGRGHIVQLVCVKPTNPSFDPMTFGLDEVVFLEGRSFFRKLQSLLRMIRKFKPSLIHSVLFEANLLGRMVRMCERNFVHLESLVNEMYSAHRLNDPHINGAKLEGYRLLDRLTQTMGVDHFHATSHSVLRHYQKKLGIRPERITVIERGRSENTYAGNAESSYQLRASLAIRKDDLILLMVGRQEFQKGYDVLLKALSKLTADMNWICLCAGREGNASKEIHTLISTLNLNNRVKWLGHRTDVMQLLAMSDIFVFSSRFEGLPGVLIEAEAAGLPIVCSDISNNREVVSEANALFFAVNNADDMAKQIAKLLNDKSLREQMGKSSRVIFNERFHLEKSHLRMEQLLVHLVGGR